MNDTTRAIVTTTVRTFGYFAFIGVTAATIGIATQGGGAQAVEQALAPMFWFAYFGTGAILSLLAAIVKCQPSPYDRT